MPSRSCLAALVPPALLLALAPAGCVPAPSDPTAALETAFPGASAVVLRPGRGFTATAGGFTAEPPALRGLGVELPALGSGAILLRSPGGAAVRVRELGADGEGRAVERAVAYGRPGGASFWTAIAGGAEEWLRFDAGAVRRGEPAAAWEIEGATLAQRGEIVEVDGGQMRLWVSAPAAYAAGGAPVQAHLRARGTTIELFVDTSGEALLVDPMWTTVAPLPAARFDQAAASLGAGQILVAGGGDDQIHAYADADVYDVAMDAWTATPLMSVARTIHTATRLGDGTVLVAGGENVNAFCLNSAEIYDPVMGAWGAPTFMPSEHAGHTGTLLAGGKVLIVGGHNSGGSGGTFTISNVDLFDPTLAMGWTAATPMNTAREYHAAARLAGTSVLVTGGESASNSALDTAELFDPNMMTWTDTAAIMNRARRYHTATLLNDGRVLIAGGDSYSDGVTPLADCEIYDPALQMFVKAASLATPRMQHTATLIPGGLVMVVGGFGNGQPLASTEIYDPVADAWSAGPTLAEARSQHTATVTGGSLLVAGGVDGVSTSSAEILALGLPDGSPTMMAADCASGLAADGVCCDTACAGACVACTAAKKGAGQDGACGPASAGPDPHAMCMDQGALSCGTNGLCDGKGACADYPAGTGCNNGDPCTDAACQMGVCVGTSKLDGSPCAGGECIAGKCLLDPKLVMVTTSASSTAGAGGGLGTTTSGSGGQGGAGGGGFEQLSGSGCAAGSRGEPSGLGAMVLALLGALGARRRRGR